jgi:hypothetical protein
MKSIKQQVRDMETELARFASIKERLTYMSMFFDNDKSMTPEARGIVRQNMKLKAE